MRNKKIINVGEELPRNIRRNSIISINSNNVTPFTHGIHKFPAKFIPQVPRWAIKKFAPNEGVVIDPFCGCGTTLVESLLLNKNSYGLEISPLAKLITKVKTTPLDITTLCRVHELLIKNIKEDRYENSYWKPSDPSLSKWFKDKTIKKLSIIRKNIFETIEDKDIRDFYLVIFSSIIRKVSNAEDQSQKVYISSRFPKPYRDPIKIFIKVADEEKRKMIKFSKKVSKRYFAKIIDFDATRINLSGNSVDLGITSPPYINAIDYISVQKLEYMWLDLWPKKMLEELRRKQMGSNVVYAKEWKKKLILGISSIDELAEKIRKKSEKHAYIFSKFYLDLKKNLKEIYRILKEGGRYIVVIGNNRINGIHIPNNLLIRDLAESNDIGFKFEFEFSYVIKNRLLRIPRVGRGGDINIDHVLVFRK